MRIGVNVFSFYAALGVNMYKYSINNTLVRARNQKLKQSTLFQTVGMMSQERENESTQNHEIDIRKK